MKKPKETLRCQNCSHEVHKWIGKCPSCNEWNSFMKFSVKESENKIKESLSKLKTLAEFNPESEQRINSGCVEFDRVMGGGIVQGSITLFSGMPGVGKSTYILKLLENFIIGTKTPILYISGEETSNQVMSRAKRLGLESNDIYFANEKSYKKIKDICITLKPKILIVDSIQTTISDEVMGAAGSVSQIKQITYDLMNLSRELSLGTIVIGHVTKDGSVAGPKHLEHMVDTVLYFDKGEEEQERILRSVKNRYGSTDEIAQYKMTSKGLEVDKGNKEILERDDAFGYSYTTITSGKRNILVETQALTVENKFGVGRRITQGLDSSRLNMIIAVIEKYLNIPLSYNDIYINITGNIPRKEHTTDLSVVASILSSYYKKKIIPDSIFVGEIGLTGDVNQLKNTKSNSYRAAKVSNIKNLLDYLM
ncbi:ATPase domain-containing protein [Bacteriovoracaceae bacterium]|nr:ATPase domain-containing protein [Bacteriovoracaceae bacterium]